MKKYDFLIVGAGLSGAVFANEAKKAGKKSLVIEKRNTIAGNLYTEKIENINVHMYGAHIFHTNNKYIWEYINNFSTFNNFINSPIACFKGELYNLPFNMNTFNKMWGVITPEDAKKKIQKELKINNNPKNLEEKAISLVGTEIYQKLIKGYTEKQWGCKGIELPAEIITRLPVRFTYNNNYFNDLYQGIPENGYTEIIEKMLHGTEVRLNTDFYENKIELLNSADKIFFTGMIDKFYDYKFGLLAYRSLKFEHEILDTDNYQGNAVFNYTDAETPFTRIIEHKFFENSKSNKTVISKEYPKAWQINDEPYYPINNEKNNEIFNKYNSLKENKNVYFGGRLGHYKYYDMDKVIEVTLKMAKNILKNA
ncbi:MAG: UDP-galactopyranose mutase [Lachnospirales bacterium]